MRTDLAAGHEWKADWETARYLVQVDHIRVSMKAEQVFEVHVGRHN